MEFQATVPVALTSTARGEIIGVAVFVLWLAVAAMVAGYGHGKGFPFFPLFISAFFLGPLWPLVLLGIALAAGPRKREVEHATYDMWADAKRREPGRHR